MLAGNTSKIEKVPEIITVRNSKNVLDNFVYFIFN
jgi:hypothetical protein